MPMLRVQLNQTQNKILNLYRDINNHSNKDKALAMLVEVEGKRAITEKDITFNEEEKDG